MVNKHLWNWLDEIEGKKKGTSLENLKKEMKRQEYDLEKKREKALKRNIKRRKGKYTTKRDQELMFGY